MTLDSAKRTKLKEESHGKDEFSLGQEEPNGAIEILVKGDSMSSNYKVRGKEISQVSRVMGRMALIIDTHESLDIGTGYIASGYDAIFRNSKTNEVTSILKFEDSYEKIGEYYVMTKQVVQEYKDNTRTITEFSYSDIKLLEPAAV